MLRSSSGDLLSISSTSLGRSLKGPYDNALQSGTIWSYHLFQFKYRIEAAELIAAAMGVYGGATAVNVKFNRYCNDQGLKNTNKPADLKVIHYMKHMK